MNKHVDQKKPTGLPGMGEEPPSGSHSEQQRVHTRREQLSSCRPSCKASPPGWPSEPDFT